MAVIRTRAELLLENANNEKPREGLEIILSQIDRISRIVKILLDYARSREPVRAPHDVMKIIEHVLKLVETEAKRRGVCIVVEPSARPLAVECDAEQLQQVFINLAVNAFDAMAPNGGTLRVTTEVEETTGHLPMVRLTFEDNGSGVAPHIQQHVFDPFFTTKPPGKGTGMGLSVSQAIINDHDGEISFDSQRSGTRFYIRIPAAKNIAAAHLNGEAVVERAL